MKYNSETAKPVGKMVTHDIEMFNTV